ncbi:AraC family transcriptional regulator [Hymenobacter sp. DH14]|uniref:AraC family transcriptional regulator n=1 Tax=Hymenobacter cyanobacteriorum TaxID=2926463 RepID=A0A9X2AGN2_9BACT|nr:AraC family transcriptional regulator [Hymenobacter cyanobacteriorum]MCI1189022.1 AraC family transcriptional regulator [Hymenobacter cyanobacteriorum]
MAFIDIEYREVKPPAVLAAFVESFWMLVNHGGEAQHMVLIPDGRIDVFFSQAATGAYQVTLRGLDTRPSAQVVPPHRPVFAISWKLLAAEYLLPVGLADLLESGCPLPPDFLGMNEIDLQDFDSFCANASARIAQALPPNIDARKRTLFGQLYASSGALTVEALAETAGWSSRQINRYFNKQFGLSLKAYSNILRFRASFQHLKAGRLFPEENFTDQAHFIREIKKYAGVVPKELARNQDDRFIQLSALPEK